MPTAAARSSSSVPQLWAIAAAWCKHHNSPVIDVDSASDKTYNCAPTNVVGASNANIAFKVP